MVLVSGYTSGDNVLLPEEDVRIQTWVFITVLCILSIVALFRKDDFARLFFAIASAFSGFNTLLLIIWPTNGLLVLALSQGANPALVLGILLIILLLTWKIFIRYSYVLWLSLIPYGKGRACRQQVIHSLQAVSTSKKRIRARRRQRVGNNASSKKAFIRFLILGSAAVPVGLMSWIMASMVLVSDDLARAIHNLNYSKAVNIMRNFADVAPDEGISFWEQFLWSNVFTLFGHFNFVVFSFLWHRWRRSRILIDRASSPQDIPPSSVLLLRHSKDDVARIPRRKYKLSRLPFMAFEWNYTFEELVAERLAFIGPLIALGAKSDESPMLDEKLKRFESTLNKSSRASLRKLGSCVEKLHHRLPARLPPQGAYRSYLGDEEWRTFIKENMARAQALVVVIGSAKESKLESVYLQEELDWIKENGYLEKTIFLMPPSLFSRKMRSRWSTFAEYLLDMPGASKALPKAKKVLCVCSYMQEPVIIMGSERSEFFYESALDIAGTFAGSTSEQRGEMIMKHRKIGLPHSSGEERNPSTAAL